MSKQKIKFKVELDERDKLKSRRRARKGRTLPHSGDGVHEDKKSKKVESQLEEEYGDEIREYIAGYSDDYDLEDDIMYTVKMTEEEVKEWEEYQKKLKEKKDATAD